MWEEDLESAARRKVMWLNGIVVAAALAIAGWYWYASRQHPVVATPVVPAAAPPPAVAGVYANAPRPPPVGATPVAPAAPPPRVSTEPQISHPIAADNAA